MSTQDQTVVPLSRKKMRLFFGMACVFVLIGLWLATMDAATVAAGHRTISPGVVNAVGWLGVLFFGACALLFGRRLRNNAPGLVVDSQGILDHSGGLAAGQIPWSDVSGIGTYEIMNQKMVVVYLHHPDRYIARGNKLQQAMRKSNHEQCGSPVTISAAGLEMDFAALYSLLVRYQEQYGQPED